MKPLLFKSKYKHQPKNFHAQQGITAVDLVIVLAVAAVIIAGIGLTAKALFSDAKINADANDLQYIMTKYPQTFAAAPDTLAATAQNVNLSGIAPTSWTLNGAGPASSLSMKIGRNLSVAPATITGAAANGISFNVSAGMSANECNAFVSQLMNISSAVVVGAGPNAVGNPAPVTNTPAGTAIKGTDGTTSAAAMTAQCANTATNQIVFYMPKG
ncbi:hypothetical protein SAMN06265795_117106 [Noviherbaspirillum humi]|uniref:PilS N terminal n=1 Tax=Noviherbaspirillum humi TaxID=1688639 RepID=A0A239KUB4_9BURK|nr:hypothetical protein [Noviherbaspirillum humi]SNT21946.1 hypothetical protein SAMN06265795_117106 [Noviherbaspirillum humi]